MGSANPIVLNVPVNVDALKSNKMHLIHSMAEKTPTKPEISTQDSSQECETIAFTYFH